MAAIVPSPPPPADDETVLTLTRQAAERLPLDPSKVTNEDMQVLVELISAGHEQVIDAINSAPPTDEFRRLEIFYDLAFAMARGILSDRLFLQGFEAVDDIEWSDWMLAHGCKPENLQSAVVRGCYDYAFVPKGKGIGAGTATLLVLRFLLTYKGSVLHELTEPMGDSIIAPFFQHLQKRKVKFEFFCRVKKLELSKTKPVVERVVLAQQVFLKNGAAYYKPLIKRKDGGASWPAQPDPNQIVDGDSLKNYDLESAWTGWQDAISERVLHRRTMDRPSDEKDTFDIVILATGFEGLKSICADFRDSLGKRWRDFLDNVKTTQTAALQLWLNPQTDELGWPDPRTALTGFERPDDAWPSAPLTSWEDNSPLLDLECDRTWPKPRSLAYFCGVFPDANYIPEPGSDPGFPDREKARARAAVIPWMNDRLGGLWPIAVAGEPPLFRWDLLEAPPDVCGEDRLDSQFLRVNIDPSERYVLSVPRSVKYRLRPDGSGIDNLYLAGDWVRSGVNAGCIEAAVIAGRMVVRAITEADMSINGDGNSDVFSVPIGALPLLNVVDKLKSVAAGGLGTLDAYCVTLRLPADEVRKKLPSDLRLITPPKWKDNHPVVLVFSRQRNVRPGILPFGGLNYHEFLELIPYVDRSETYAPAGGPFTYMPYLLLDQPLAVALGVGLYGFNKRLARISAKDGAYVVSGDLSDIRTDFHAYDLPGTLDEVASVSCCSQFLELPFISQKSTGEWVYSYLDYRLETATFQRIFGYVAIGPPFVPEAVKKSSKDEEESKTEEIAWFRFSSDWRLSMPLTSGQLTDASTPVQIRNTISQWTGGGFRQLFRR